MPKTVLITGAAGFIGSHLCDRMLREGWRVAGIDNFCDFYPEPMKRANIEQARRHERFDLLELDIRDAAGVGRAFAEHRPDAVVHLAAMAGVRPSIERPAYYTQVNLDGTVNLLDAAVSRGVERFVFASSSSVYGNNDKVPFAEDDAVNEPISPYAATKRAGELICHTYHHLHGLPLACLRFFTVYGPRQRPDLAIGKFMRMIDRGEPIPVFGDGSTSRDYTYIDDIIEGVAAALQRAEGFRIYNLGNRSPVKLSELIETIEGVVGREAKIDRRPMQPGDVNRTWADIRRAEAELDFHPGTELTDGLEQQWRWLRQQQTAANT